MSRRSTSSSGVALQGEEEQIKCKVLAVQPTLGCSAQGLPVKARLAWLHQPCQVRKRYKVSTGQQWTAVQQGRALQCTRVCS